MWCAMVSTIPRDRRLVAHLAASRDELTTEVTDPGRAFNPLDVAAPDLTAPLAERSLGGLGIHLVRSLMDSVEYRRENGKNVLTLRKRIR